MAINSIQALVQIETPQIRVRVIILSSKLILLLLIFNAQNVAETAQPKNWS